MSNKARIRPREQGHHFDGDLRRALLDAAAAAIVERGVEAVSLREVARRVGVSHAAPAHHFGDKAGLHTALAVEGFERLADALERRVALPRYADDPVGALVAAGGEYVRFATTHPAHFELMFRPSLLRFDDAELMDAADRAHGALDAAVERCRDTGWGGDESVATLSALAWGLVHGVAALRMQGALHRYYPKPTTERVTALFEVLGAALGPAD